jgi:CRISPR-associated protein Cmr5
MKKLDELIPIALKVIEECLLDSGKIPRQYNGYISSFGAMVRSGLKPAIAFFENKDSEAQQDRSKITKAILKIICRDKNISSIPDTLLEYVLQKEDTDAYILKKEILEAATALKLAMRTFEFK